MKSLIAVLVWIFGFDPYGSNPPTVYGCGGGEQGFPLGDQQGDPSNPCANPDSNQGVDGP